MSLTKEQREEYDHILTQTGGHKESLLEKRVIPPEYLAFQSQCTREETLLCFPGLDPVRVILTRAKAMAPEAPLHLNFHGGGFVFKQNGDDDLYCAHLAAATGGMVVDVDYASSKEAPYPMAFDQCYQVARWAWERLKEWGCSPKKFSVGGSSAGGNLALATAMKAKDTGDFSLCLLVQEYAANDNFQCVGDPQQLRSEVFSRLYVDGDLELLKDPYVSPSFASDAQLQGLPPVLFICPKLCPFYHVNNRLGMRMADLGVRVTFQTYPQGPHGFTVRMTGEGWLDSQNLVIQAIRQESL